MTDTTAADGMLAFLNRELEAEKTAVEEKLQRIRALGLDYAEERKQCESAYNEYRLRIANMEREREHIVGLIVKVKMTERPEPIIYIPKD